MIMIRRRCAALFFLSSVFGLQATYAQNTSYEDSFCSYYSYTVECYSYRSRAEEKIEGFVEVYTMRMESKNPAQALPKLRAMQEEIQNAIQFYEGTHWEFLIRFFADQFVAPIQELEYELSSISIDQQFINEQLKSAVSKDEFLETMRTMVISQLIQSGYDGFNQRPFGTADNSGLLNDGYADQVFVSTPIYQDDVLDLYLNDQLRDVVLGDTMDADLMISPSVYNAWKWKVQLFKNTEDLEALGYQVVSHRVRINSDTGYRRANIAQAFNQIGHVRVLNPGDEISYLEDSNFDPYTQALYEDGLVINMDEEVEEYGGGLCGGSTAIYQWIVTNKALSRPALRNHSKRYHHLYDATIDGQLINTPGIDSTIYSNSLDLRMKNIANHPVILVSNYEGGMGEEEEVFTIGYASDRGSITYVWSRPHYATLSVAWWWSKSVVGECHTWNINGTERESCYKEIKK